jgi:hypothetical protein
METPKKAQLTAGKIAQRSDPFTAILEVSCRHAEKTLAGGQVPWQILR